MGGEGELWTTSATGLGGHEIIRRRMFSTFYRLDHHSLKKVETEISIDKRATGRWTELKAKKKEG